MVKRRALFLLAAAAVVALALFSSLHHAPPTLLQHSYKAAVLGQWDAAQDNYLWTSEQNALVLTRAREFAPVRIQTLNASTGHLAPADVLQSALQTAGADAALPRWQLSPDRRWLLAEGAANTGSPLWVAMTVDGQHHVVRPRSVSSVQTAAVPNYSAAAWRPDSRSWLQMERNQASGRDDALVSLYQLGTPAVTTNVEGFMPAGRSVLGFHAPTRALAIYPHTGDGGGIGYVDFGAAASDSLCRIYYQHIPPNLDVQEVCLSPDGTQLAWLFAVKPLPLGLQSTINSNYVRHSAPNAVGLWVSDLDCGHLRELGRMDIRDGPLSTLHWLPGGHAVSFVNNAALYTISAD